MNDGSREDEVSIHTAVECPLHAHKYKYNTNTNTAHDSTAPRPTHTPSQQPPTVATSPKSPRPQFAPRRAGPSHWPPWGRHSTAESHTCRNNVWRVTNMRQGCVRFTYVLTHVPVCMYVCVCVCVCKAYCLDSTCVYVCVRVCIHARVCVLYVRHTRTQHSLFARLEPNRGARPKRLRRRRRVSLHGDQVGTGAVAEQGGDKVEGGAEAGGEDDTVATGVDH